MNDLSQLYDTDFRAWAQRTAELLRAGRYDALDIDHLLDELDDMGKSEHREVELAAKETELPRHTFPSTCPYSPAQILDDRFFPRP
jgi:hypothetical protein